MKKLRRFDNGKRYSRRTAQSCKKIVQKYAKIVDTLRENCYSKTVSLYIYLCLVFIEALIHNMLILLVFLFSRSAARSTDWGLKKCRIIPDEGQTAGVKKRTQDKKASLHTVRLPTVRSARVLRLFSGGGSGEVYRRGWVSRPERTKYQSERGTCPLLAPFAVQIAKTHFAALCRIYRPCEFLTGIFIATLCRVFSPAAHSVRVGAEQTILRHGFCRATSFQKEVSVLLKGDANCFVKSSFRKELSNEVRLRIDKLRKISAEE